jgi:aldose 1-epimerase
MPSLLTLEAGDARVLIVPDTGGAIAAYTWRGDAVLRPTPREAIDAGRVGAHASWPLVPFSNRIACAQFVFEGEVHRLARNHGEHAIHGVGRQRPWTVTWTDGSAALLAYEHRADASWPWPFRTTQWLQLVADAHGSALRMRLAIANTGPATFPFGLGWHPYFPRDAATTLHSQAQGLWETDAAILPTRLVRPEGARDFSVPHAIGATFLDNVYSGWAGEARLCDAGRGRTTTVRADSACAFLVVYAPPEPFVALEPVTHMTDAFNRAAAGETATGARTLEPGESFSCTMEISTRMNP